MPEIPPDAMRMAIEEITQKHNGVLSSNQVKSISYEGESIGNGVLGRFSGNVSRVIVIGLLELSLLAAFPRWVHGAEGESGGKTERQNTAPNSGDLSRATEQVAKEAIESIEKLNDALREFRELLEKRGQELLDRKLGKDSVPDAK